MVSGYPIRDPERRLIREMHERGLFASQIAAHISSRYPEWCGGERTTKAVNEAIRTDQLKELQALGARLNPLPPDEAPYEPPVKKVPDMRKMNGKKQGA